MTENIQKLLESISQNEELTKKIGTMTKDDLVALAKGLGIELTEEDFAQPTSELDDDALDTVVGGGACFCAMGGGGTKDSNDHTCACVASGGGSGKNGKVRCFCIAGGWGKDN